MKRTRRVRRRKQRAGMAKIGEGRNGFVIDPAIPCKGMDTSQYVSKVFEGEGETYRKRMFKALKKADPEQKYLLYPIFCETVGELTEENIKDGVNELNKHLSYLVKRGGKITLEDFVKNNKKPSMTNEQVIDFMTGTLSSVFKAVEFMHDKNFIHNDLHLKNILMTEDGHAQIIDFDITEFGDADPQKLRESKQNEMQGVIEDIAKILMEKPDNIKIIDKVYEKLPLKGGRRRKTRRRRRKTASK